MKAEFAKYAAIVKHIGLDNDGSFNKQTQYNRHRLSRRRSRPPCGLYGPGLRRNARLTGQQRRAPVQQLVAVPICFDMGSNALSSIGGW